MTSVRTRILPPGSHSRTVPSRLAVTMCPSGIAAMAVIAASWPRNGSSSFVDGSQTWPSPSCVPVRRLPSRANATACIWSGCDSVTTWRGPDQTYAALLSTTAICRSSFRHARGSAGMPSETPWMVGAPSLFSRSKPWRPDAATQTPTTAPPAPLPAAPATNRPCGLKSTKQGTLAPGAAPRRRRATGVFHLHTDSPPPGHAA